MVDGLTDRAAPSLSVSVSLSLSLLSLSLFSRFPSLLYWARSERLGRGEAGLAACALATPKSLGLQFIGIDSRE